MDACLFHSWMALPEDAWRVVAGHVETERELCALACTSRELRRVLEDDDVWRRVFERRFEMRFVNEHERRRGREATVDERDSDEKVSGLVSSSPVAGSIPRGIDSSRGVAFAPSADDPHPERWSVRVYPRSSALASPFYLELPLHRPVLGHRDGAHGTRRGDADAWGIPWLHVRHRTYREWTKDAFYCVHRERVRGSFMALCRAQEMVWATESEIRRTMRSLEALAQKEASVKAKPTNAVRRRSQKLKDIAHQALCLGNVLERLGRERGDWERERLTQLSRAPSEALRRYKKAALGVGGEARTGGGKAGRPANA